MKKSSKPITSHLSDFLDWLDIEKGLSSKSQENYKRFIERFFYWLKISKLGNLKPHQLTSEHIWDYRVFLSRKYPSKTKKPLKRSSQNYYLIALRALLSYFSAKDIISLPTDKIKLPKDIKRSEKVKFLNLDQIKKLLGAPDIKKENGLRDRAILETLFSTGLRISELTSLNKEQIKIKPGLKEIEVGIIGKGNRPRTIYLSERAINWLDKYLKTRKDKEKALFINYRSKKDASRRLTARAIEKIIKKYAIATGLPITTTPHVMRHSFATDLLSKGADLRAVQEFLGHKNITATQIYTHITNKRLKELHQKYHSGKELK